MVMVLGSIVMRPDSGSPGCHSESCSREMIDVAVMTTVSLIAASQVEGQIWWSRPVWHW